MLNWHLAWHVSVFQSYKKLRSPSRPFFFLVAVVGPPSFSFYFNGLCGRLRFGSGLNMRCRLIVEQSASASGAAVVWLV
jgi:hypothetical protein